jgi:hypothetical protein
MRPYLLPFRLSPVGIGGTSFGFTNLKPSLICLGLGGGGGGGGAALDGFFGFSDIFYPYKVSKR